MRRKHEHPEGQSVIRYAMRLPRDLYDELAHLSEEGGWSMHAEMVQGLREHVARRRARQARIARTVGQERQP